MTRIVEALLQFNGLTDRANQIIEEIDWDLLLPGCDAELAAANWHDKVMEIMQACIPQQTLTKRRKCTQEWLTVSENVMLPSRL